MHAETWTLRGTGWERVEGYGTVTRKSVHVVPLAEPRVLIKVGNESGAKTAEVCLTLDELRMVVEALRAKGIEIDPLREKQRKVAWALSQSLGLPEEAKTSEAPI